MKAGIGGYLDLILLIMMLMFSVINLPVIAEEWAKPILSEIEDKTALTTENGIYVGTTMNDGNDLLMSIVAVDTHTPFPRSIKINDCPIIDFSDVWITDKTDNIREIFDVSGQYKLGSMLDYKIENVDYVNNGGDPYLHYVLKEVTP